MKVNKDDKLFKYSIYVIVTAVIIYIAYSVMGNLGQIITAVLKIIGIILTLLKPLVIGIIIAYLFNAPVCKIESILEKNKILKKSESRKIVGIVISYVVVATIIVSILCGIYIMIGGQLSRNMTIANTINYISEYLSSTDLSVNAIESKLESLNIPLPDNINNVVATLVSTIQKYVVNSIGSMAGSVVNFGSSLAAFFISFILSIYLLKDIDYFMNLWRKMYYIIFRDSRTGGKIRDVFMIVNNTFSNYIRGQLLDAVIVGALSAVALSIIGIDYAVIIGIISGICNLIPYIGPVVGTVLAGIMGLLSGKPIMILWAVIAMLIVQQVDNNLLAPRIVGNSVGLHPVFTMLAILVGGNIGGLIGMLVAVPITAAAKTLISKWYDANIGYEPSKIKINDIDKENKDE